MTRYRHTLEFGLSLDPTATEFSTALRLARRADAAGLDYLAVQDHPYQPAHLEVWTMLTYLLAKTDRIAVVSDVIDIQLRLPTIVAKAAASLASIAGGRVHLGVGGGATADGIAALGGTPRRGAAMVDYTEQAVQILRSAVRGGSIRTGTTSSGVTGYRAGPVPPQPIEVWVGSQKPKMLAVTGRVGDGWVCPLNIYVAPVEVPERQRAIDAAAEAAGRDPREVRRVYNVIGRIGQYSGGSGLVGPVEAWVSSLSAWATDLGFDTFIFWPAVDDAEAQLDLFATEVVPAVRQRVADAPGRA